MKRIAILESNLMWSARLARSVAALGYEAVMLEDGVRLPPGFDVAILDLSRLPEPAAEYIDDLHRSGVVTIGHAGHKEHELMDLGRKSGCRILATNREMTTRLGALIAEALALKEGLCDSASGKNSV